MSYYFGEPWPSGICDGGIQIETPVGMPCVFCDEPIVDGDQGSFVGTPEGAVPEHKECALRVVIGGIGHLEDHGRWCGPNGDPDGGRTRRQSALEVWVWVQRHGTTAAFVDLPGV